MKPTIHQTTITRRESLKTMGLFASGCVLGVERRTVSGADIPTAGTSCSAHDLFQQYERRFAEAGLRMPERNPAVPADRETIARVAKDCLGIRDEWVPTIRAEKVREAAFDGGRIEMPRATSWPGVTATALLYLPADAPDRPLPLVILCCGHGKGGKLADGYQRMARHITRRGAMVLCPDNLGQGERVAMGHADCVKPFACGSSVQGLIVMETMGWLRWALKQPRVDPRRVAAIGNSGGGTLTVFLAALCPELAALSSSGYPSTFDFVARKEKKHCHCNILPGAVGQLEMWQLLGSFAPRPLFIFQGDGDPLFPPDLFFHTARKVRQVYRARNAEKAFESRVMTGGHSWDAPRNVALGQFLARHLNLKRSVGRENENEPLLTEKNRCLDSWPANALTTDQLAEQLTGRRANDGIRLWDVYPPPVPRDVPLEDIAPRGSTRQIFAQFEAFLRQPKPKP
ncbi:MAG: acetylxylan esterase [Verrucomicrobia bacterium]|nr:acetylxylan esterase [Verrucomicrobiota bacterium]